MIKKTTFFLASLLALAGCDAGTQVITSRSQVEVPRVSSSMFVCPEVESWPDPDKLTDIQIARLLIELRRNNQVCKNSLEAIRLFLDRARELSSTDAR